MSKERLVGILMGIGAGVAIGYHLKPRKDEIPAGSNGLTEHTVSSGSATPKPASDAVSTAQAASLRAIRA